ncbi:MAG TPA: GNAT family N-acetyltransferase [Actinomycetota bacterium]
MSTAEIRAPAEGERERIAEAMATSLNSQRERAVARSHLYDLDDMRVAVIGDDVVATAGEFRFDQWFGGRSLACSAIWGVTTLPEHRGSGLGSGVTESVLRAGRDRGAVVSALFPAVLAPYRSLGFEMAGTFTKHRVAIDAIPRQPEGLPMPEPYESARDLADVRVAYRGFVSGHTGPVEPTADAHWAERIMHRSDDETRRAVVVREHGELTGFLVTGRDPDPGRLDVEFGLWTEAFVASTESALRSLLAYVRRFGGIGRWFQWTGPPNDAIALLMPDQSTAIDMHYRWMLRLLDVPAAFEGRGWPAIDAEAVFAVDDALFPDNAGPWLLRVEKGRATVTRYDGEHPTVLPIGALSSMFTGYLRPGDAVRLGAIDADDPAIDAFCRLFSGPDPWCPFFF